MNLFELQKIINYTVERLPTHENLEDLQVVIQTNDRSVGCGAYSDIKHIYRGIDFEHHQIRIKPSENLVKEPYKPVKSVIREDFGGVSFWACPFCHLKVAKDDYYCRHCGQKLI